MQMKLTFAVLAALTTMNGHAASLNELTERALARNPEVAARLHEFFAADAEQQASRGALRPRIDLEASVGHERVDTPASSATSFNHPGASIQLRQLLLDGGATRNEIRRLGFAKTTRYYELLQVSNDTALEIARAALDIQRYRQLSRLAQDNWAIHKETYEQIASRVKAGVGRRVDLEQAAGRLALAQSNWLTETSNLHDVGARFERIVGEAPPAQLDTPEITSELPVEKEVLTEAVRANPMFLAGVANLRAARAQTDVRRAANAPSVEFRASHGVERNRSGVHGPYSNSVAQIVLSYNLYRGGADQARIRQAQEQFNAAVDLRNKACRDLRQTTVIAWNDIRKQREQIKFLEQHQLSTEKARDAYRQQFDIGQRSLLDLLDTENELFQARRALAQAQSDLRLAEYRVLNSTHRLLPALGLADKMQAAPEEANTTERPEDAIAECSTEMPAFEPLDLNAAVSTRTQPIAALQPLLPQAALSETVPAQCEFAAKDWAAAWSAKDLDKYLGYYSNDFQPATRADREDWRRFRAQRLEKPSIAVKLENLVVKQLSGDSCNVSFNQQYRSTDFNDDVFKTMALKREGAAWKVVREITPRKSSSN